MTSVGTNAQGLPEYDLPLSPDVSMRFVLVPAGAFTMGRRSAGERPDRARPTHVATLQAFLLAKTECTRRQWQAVMGEDSRQLSSWRLDHPVTRVAWVDLGSFKARTALRLPSEAEWEYAARAGSESDWPSAVDAFAWHAGNAEGSAHPVGTKRPNAFGLHDTLGNVREWCEDGPRPRDADAPGDGTAWDHEGEFVRVLRGGGWMNPPASSNWVRREYFNKAARSPNLGFRPARSLR